MAIKVTTCCLKDTLMSPISPALVPIRIPTRRIKVIVLGAGASGIDFFKNAEERLENVEIQCYEKNGDIGGTVSKQLRGNYRRTAENSLAA